MRTRVYFSFDRANEPHRVYSVLSMVRSVVRPANGFLDLPEKYRDKRGRRIARDLKRTAVTVVLIGSKTALCPRVQEELKLSVERGNGLLGLYIHDAGKPCETESSRGAKPDLPGGLWFPAYDWDGDLKRFTAEVNSAAGRSAKKRKRPDFLYFPALGW